MAEDTNWIHEWQHNRNITGGQTSDVCILADPEKHASLEKEGLTKNKDFEISEWKNSIFRMGAVGEGRCEGRPTPVFPQGLRTFRFFPPI